MNDTGLRGHSFEYGIPSQVYIYIFVLKIEYFQWLKYVQLLSVAPIFYDNLITFIAWNILAWARDSRVAPFWSEQGKT